MPRRRSDVCRSCVATPALFCRAVWEALCPWADPCTPGGLAVLGLAAVLPRLARTSPEALATVARSLAERGVVRTQGGRVTPLAHLLRRLATLWDRGEWTSLPDERLVVSATALWGRGVTPPALSLLPPVPARRLLPLPSPRSRGRPAAEGWWPGGAGLALCAGR